MTAKLCICALSAYIADALFDLQLTEQEEQERDEGHGKNIFKENNAHKEPHTEHKLD